MGDLATAVPLGPLLGPRAAGFEFRRDVPVLSGKHRPRQSAVRRTAAPPGEFVAATLKKGDHGKFYCLVNVGGLRLRYAHVILAVNGRPRPTSVHVPHHEAYVREMYNGQRVWVGDDSGVLRWQTRRKHPKTHGLADQGHAAIAAGRARRKKRGRKPTPKAKAKAGADT